MTTRKGIIVVLVGFVLLMLLTAWQVHGSPTQRYDPTICNEPSC